MLTKKDKEFINWERRRIVGVIAVSVFFLLGCEAMFISMLNNRNDFLIVSIFLFAAMFYFMSKGNKLREEYKDA